MVEEKYIYSHWIFLNKLFFNVQYSFLDIFNDCVLKYWIKYFSKIYVNKYMLFHWDIIHVDWLAYLKAWYKMYSPRYNFFTNWIKIICMILPLDVKWIMFEIKLFVEMDYGFLELNIMRVKVKYFPTFYHLITKCYDIIIFSYIYFFIDWWYHYFTYRLVFFIDTKLNFLYINSFFIFIINIFYNFICFLKYGVYHIILNIYTPFSEEMFQKYMSEFMLIIKPVVRGVSRYKIVRAYIFADLVLLIDYYWFYFYHYLYFYSYQFIHNFYNWWIYLLKFFVPNWWFANTNYNILYYYEILNMYFTVPILHFFHEFMKYFIKPSYDFNYWQNEYNIHLDFIFLLFRDNLL